MIIICIFVNFEKKIEWHDADRPIDDAMGYRLAQIKSQNITMGEKISYIKVDAASQEYVLIDESMQERVLSAAQTPEPTPSATPMTFSVSNSYSISHSLTSP